MTETREYFEIRGVVEHLDAPLYSETHIAYVPTWHEAPEVITGLILGNRIAEALNWAKKRYILLGLKARFHVEVRRVVR